MDTQVILYVLFIVFVASPLGNALARLIVNIFEYNPTYKITKKETDKIVEDFLFGNGGIICTCGHQIEEHDNDGCSVMTVTTPYKVLTPSIINSCNCKLTPDDIRERTIDG